MYTHEELKEQEKKVHEALEAYIHNKRLATIKIYAQEIKKYLQMLLTPNNNGQKSS